MNPARPPRRSCRRATDRSSARAWRDVPRKCGARPHVTGLRGAHQEPARKRYTVAAMAVTPGQRLGQYEIVAQIGKGGMATVFRATQPSLGRQVAIKVLPPHFAEDPAFHERFR